MSMDRKQTLSFPFQPDPEDAPVSTRNKAIPAPARYVFGRGQVAMEQVIIPPAPRLPSDTEPAPRPKPEQYNDWLTDVSDRLYALRREVNEKVNSIADGCEGDFGRRLGSRRDRTPLEALDDLVEMLMADHNENCKKLEFFMELQQDLEDNENRETA